MNETDSTIRADMLAENKLTRSANLPGVIPAMERKARILVVDDEHDILELIRYNLSREGYHLTCVDNGEKALTEAKAGQPDVILLDLMLPGVDGLEVCRILKASRETSQIPIIMLTAKTEEVDIVTGLELGADDYVTKPFSPRVLLARVRTILRRKNQSEADEREVIRRSDLVIHLNQHAVYISADRIDLTSLEFRILVTLARRPGWVYSRDRIVVDSQGGNAVVTPRSVDVHIVSLRRKLGSYGECIETVRGVGYRFREISAT